MFRGSRPLFPSPGLGSFHLLFLQITFLPLFLFLPWDPYNVNVSMLDVVSEVA